MPRQMAGDGTLSRSGRAVNGDDDLPGGRTLESFLPTHPRFFVPCLGRAVKPNRLLFPAFEPAARAGLRLLPRGPRSGPRVLPGCCRRLPAGLPAAWPLEWPCAGCPISLGAAGAGGEAALAERVPLADSVGAVSVAEALAGMRRCACRSRRLLAWDSSERRRRQAAPFDGRAAPA
jgi:hypothetical protein